jgi:hypothetical protein
VLVLVVSLVVARIIVRFIGEIYWSEVAAAFGRLSWWQFIPLVAALIARQALNAIPLSRFVPGLSWRRSLQNDLAANVVGTLSPPPSDVVLRIAMFKSWQIDPVDGMAGVTLNMITFYIVRFIAPTLGLMILAFEEVQSHHLVTALVAGFVAAFILIGLVLIMRGDSLASVLGRSAGRVASRIRSGVDPEKWAGAWRKHCAMGFLCHLLRWWSWCLAMRWYYYFQFVSWESVEVSSVSWPFSAHF